ncbi:hypothetical protein KBC03_01125 [Patescibacteria group bacterium]|nr:hypothetical protein [Patescibacteria group bacterium]
MDSVSEDDKTFLKDYFDFSDGTSLVAAFEDYKTNSTERFRSLEDA